MLIFYEAKEIRLSNSMEFCGGKSGDCAAYLEKFSKYICWLNI
jgi:hypothetical protein